jgi:hypothetical protein
VTIRSKETLAMIQTVVVTNIEAKESKDENLHAFEIINTDWVPENSVLRKPTIF